MPLGEHAVDFMERTIAASAAPVTLVPTGPLTNIALLLERTGGANIERIVLMGGAVAEGNMTPAAEFNIWADPEAAQAVFHAGIDTTMIGLDVTHRARDDTRRCRSGCGQTGTIGAFVADLVDFFAVYHRETYGWDGAPIHDAVAVAHVIRPGLVTTIERNVEVELESDLCRGRTVVDRWQRTERPANAHVGIDLDTGRLLRPPRRADRAARLMGDVVVFVEVPSGSRNKYELDPELGGIVLDRRLFTSMSYPADYGFIEGTMGEDGDPLDALVLVGEPTFPGCRIRVRVVGVFHMTDEKGPDEKVICVPLKDPAWMRVSDIHDIPPEFRDEIEHFFQVYKDLEEGKTETRGFGNRADAELIIEEARARAEVTAARPGYAGVVYSACPTFRPSQTATSPAARVPKAFSAAWPVCPASSSRYVSSENVENVV